MLSCISLAHLGGLNDVGVGDRARCPCEGLAPFLEAEAAWHDIVLPASPPTGDLTRGAAAQTRYVDLKDHSIQCFLNATLCEAP